jgi:hypothetical protein
MALCVVERKDKWENGSYNITYERKYEWKIMMYDNNSIQFFIIYVPSQQLQGQLQTQHSVDTSNYIMDKHNINSKIN